MNFRRQQLTVRLATVGALAITFSISAAQANLLSDGSFEQQAVATGGFIGFSAGSSFGGWQVSAGRVLLTETTCAEPDRGISAFNSDEGRNSVDLTGVGNEGLSTSIFQTASTTVGRHYELTFTVGRGMSSNQHPNFNNPVTVDVAINGGSRISFTNSNLGAPGFIDWQSMTMSFVASSPQTTISFLNGTSNPTTFAGVDNVRLVEAVPEPATLAALGLGALGLLRRRKVGDAA